MGIVLPAGCSQNTNKSLCSPHTVPFACFCIQMQPFIIAVKTVFCKKTQVTPPPQLLKKYWQDPVINKRAQNRNKRNWHYQQWDTAFCPTECHSVDADPLFITCHINFAVWSFSFVSELTLEEVGGSFSSLCSKFCNLDSKFCTLWLWMVRARNIPKSSRRG